jgi:hypothetical protein
LEEDGESKGDLNGCVLETMTFLGMAENTDRFLRLLKQARITSLEGIAALGKQECDQLQLPYDLIIAVQKRHRVWQIEMVDDAEKGLEAGEKYYQIGRNDRFGGNYPMTLDEAAPNPAKNNYLTDTIEAPYAPSSSNPPRAPTDEIFLEHMGKKFDLLEGRLLEKVQEVVERVGENNLQELRSAMERSQSLLEGKMEYVWSMQGKQHKEEIQKEMGAQLDTIAAKIVQCSPDGTLPAAASTLAVQPIETKLAELTKKVDGLLDAQQNVFSHFGGKVTEMTDGLAQQIIQESKVAAFTLQSKLASMEEQQKHKQAEIEERLGQRIQKVVDDNTSCLRGFMAQQSKDTSDKLMSSMDIANTDRVQLEHKLADMVKSMNSETSQKFEMGLGVFGNALRAQLDTMQAAQVGARKESDQSLTAKLDGLVGRTKDQSTRQLDAIKGLQRNIEDAVARSGRHRDRGGKLDSTTSSQAGDFDGAHDQAMHWWSGEPHQPASTSRPTSHRQTSSKAQRTNSST